MIKKCLRISLFTMLFFTIILSLSACVYDPPPVGKDIFFENQTDNFLFITPAGKIIIKSSLPLRDTFLVNKKAFCLAKPNWISPYTKWFYFLSENQIIEMKKKKEREIEFVVFSKNDYTLIDDKILLSTTYKKEKLNIEEIEKNEINHVFCYGDTIYLSHTFNMNMEQIKKY